MTDLALVALPSVIIGSRPMSAVPGVRSRASSPVQEEPETVQILSTGLDAPGRRHPTLSEVNLAEVIEFDPLAVRRLDVDLHDWSLFTGEPGARKSQTEKATTSEWKI